jgi:aspartyl-tRNA(Asn)/glutamyl-tRNA(Gln) amidotransferase subunit B
MRTKEDAHDYRYFPDPDLPPLVIEKAWIDAVRAAMPELPQAMAQRLAREHALPAHDAAMLTASPASARYFEAAVAALPAGGTAGSAKLVANWMMGELARRLNAAAISIEVSPVGPLLLARLVARIADGTVSNSAARRVFDALWSGDANDVDALIDAMGLRQLSDTGALEAVIETVIAGNPRSVEEYRAGKEKAFNALVGQAMKATRGKANPEQVHALLKRKLG